MLQKNVVSEVCGVGGARGALVAHGLKYIQLMLHDPNLNQLQCVHI